MFLQFTNNLLDSLKSIILFVNKLFMDTPLLLIIIFTTIHFISSKSFAVPNDFSQSACSERCANVLVKKSDCGDNCKSLFQGLCLAACEQATDTCTLPNIEFDTYSDCIDYEEQITPNTTADSGLSKEDLAEAFCAGVCPKLSLEWVVLVVVVIILLLIFIICLACCSLCCCSRSKKSSRPTSEMDDSLIAPVPYTEHTQPISGTQLT